jgi:phenylacetate-CoA ligase
MLWLRKQKDPVIGGYPSSLFILADDAERKGISFNAKTCITWGDKLFDHYNEKIEKVFNTKVFETYGSAEGFLIAAQHDTPFMYIMSNNIVLEIVDDNGDEVKDGELGHVVVTNLYNYIMPLIRYRLGDLAVKLPRSEYPEKRMLDLPLLKKVIGRNTDIIRTPSGNKLIVHSFTGIFEHFQEIKQFQIVQKTLSRIDIRYIPGEGFSESVIHKINQKLMDLTGGEIKIKFLKVENIKPSGSGKPQIIISEIQNGITKK